jgi:hypothetical protein
LHCSIASHEISRVYIFKGMAHAAVAAKMSATPALVIKAREKANIVVSAAMTLRRLLILSTT